MACPLYYTAADTVRYSPVAYFADMFIIKMKKQIKQSVHETIGGALYDRTICT